MFVLYSLSAILCKNKKVNKTVLGRLKVKGMFYMYPCSASTEFSSKLIVSGLLMLWRIQQ